jgi:hypothetical protein
MIGACVVRYSSVVGPFHPDIHAGSSRCPVLSSAAVSLVRHRADGLLAGSGLHTGLTGNATVSVDSTNEFANAEKIIGLATVLPVIVIGFVHQVARAVTAGLADWFGFVVGPVLAPLLVVDLFSGHWLHRDPALPLLGAAGRRGRSQRGAGHRHRQGEGGSRLRGGHRHGNLRRSLGRLIWGAENAGPQPHRGHRHHAGRRSHLGACCGPPPRRSPSTPSGPRSYPGPWVRPRSSSSRPTVLPRPRHWPPCSTG